jgi:cytoskeletal protein CcmA (bactofilin family)
MVAGRAAARSTASEASSLSERAESILGRGARVRGRVSGDGDLRVEGSVEGDVRVSGQLAIEEGGSVTGDVEAAVVVIGGALTGDVAASGAVAVRAGARVVGDLAGAEVSLEEGASFEGRIDAELDLPPELQPSLPSGAPRPPNAAGRGR